MSRIDTSHWDTTPKHHDLQIKLLDLIAQFEMTVKFGEVPCYALRVNMINLIQVARQELEQCTTRFEDMVKHIADERWPDHMDLLTWLNDMSIACKLLNIRENQTDFLSKPIHDAVLKGQIINARNQLTRLSTFSQGVQLVNKLDACRQSRDPSFDHFKRPRSDPFAF